ncbi:uncharacterized protein B0J16DRAFT_405252 [Fusarium flagelliforme]|uniref:uncharacterized protein n=1 Tax=Fusarium flagelliforme TaxID=2675880 RepID=UPI001E8D03EB|nr:uncharacterized protein B0J16DRAFT_405252 [Fusarium flagelliforme]KAH7175145.1 hypothetical protein B0J16DRAFT_405252 [Fusarium flagelliforme]
MSQAEQQENSAEESEGDLPLTKSPSNPTGGRKPTKLAMQNAAVTEEVTEDGALRRTNPGRRIGPIRESRIEDRPAKEGEKDSSLKIKIELDREVEGEIYARVKGDVTIGLM